MAKKCKDKKYLDLYLFLKTLDILIVLNFYSLYTKMITKTIKTCS